MILSVSRRTDIPAFYMAWFLKRLEEAYVLVRNPINPKQVSRVSLNRESIDLIVFWTKNPKYILENINSLKEYPFYVHVTINPYNKDIEVGVPKKGEIMDSFIDLSKIIGKERMIWRYDPIIFTSVMDEAYHLKYFEMMAKRLSGYTKKCVFSFLRNYRKTIKNMADVDYVEPNIEEQLKLIEKLKLIGQKHGIELCSCSESNDFTSIGIEANKCIDDVLISRILGGEVTIAKDPHQREECGCVKSIDIGAYDTCPHQCKYCYANNDMSRAIRQYNQHHPDSPLLFGKLKGDEKISNRKIDKHKVNQQLSFF